MKRKSKSITFRLDEETRQRLDAMAAATNRSRAQVIRLLLDAVVPVMREEDDSDDIQHELDTGL